MEAGYRAGKEGTEYANPSVKNGWQHYNTYKKHNKNRSPYKINKYAQTLSYRLTAVRIVGTISSCNDSKAKMWRNNHQQG